MLDQAAHEPWLRQDWLAHATAWIDGALEHNGLRVSGAIERLHAGRWSTVLRAPTRDGDVYFKASVPLPTYEPALTAALARRRPDCIVRVLAADAQRGWLLTAHGGMRLREVIRSDRDLGHWLRLLPMYAALQLEMGGRVDELLALGVPDRRLALLPAGYERLLADRAALHLGQPWGLTLEEQQGLRMLISRFTALCSELAGYQLPATLHHGDLHDGNVLVHGGRYRFFDWGNSVVAHPFFSLRTTLKSARYTFDLGDDAGELARLRDCYLEPWLRYASRRDLLVALELAHSVGMVSNALTWYDVLSRPAIPHREDDDEPVPRLLREFLHAQTNMAAR